MKRLTWLVGPPGAGKSTYVATLEGTRVVEMVDMLAPLVAPVNLQKGILQANGALIALIRALELHPDNRALPPLLVVAGLVPESALYPLAPEDEEVVLLLPERERWQIQLQRRPVGGGSSRQYADYDYAAAWYDRFAAWRERGYPCRVLEVPYQPELLGRTASRLAEAELL